MADHERNGCRGERDRPCSCSRDRFEALIASVSKAERLAQAGHEIGLGER